MYVSPKIGEALSDPSKWVKNEPPQKKKDRTLLYVAIAAVLAIVILKSK